MVRADQDFAALRNVLSSGLVRRARKGLGGSHTVVTYPPLDVLHPLDDPSRVEADIRACDGLNLYVHVAFCEFICAFCHYTKARSHIDAETDIVSSYLDAVGRELESRRAALSGASIDSLYIGGGTPTVLPTGALVSLIEQAADLGGTRAHRICVETSPLTLNAGTGRAKLDALLAMGVDRFSVGVQSFDDALLRAHRGHSHAELMTALGYLRERAPALNIDLIQDLPGQSPKSIPADIEGIRKVQPDQVTWYILRTGSGSRWHKTGRTGRDDMPSDLESGRRRLEIIDAMESIGYHACGGGRFMRACGTPDHYKNVRQNASKALLGFGASAYSHGWGWFFRNGTSSTGGTAIRNYIRTVKSGKSPIGSARRLTKGDCRAATLSTAIRHTLPADLLTGDTEQAGRTRALADRLTACGAAVRDAGGNLRLTRYGRAYEEEIASLFYGQPIRNELAVRGLLWSVEA